MNGVGTRQLKRLAITYCKHSGSSRGVRAFVENGLADFVSANPELKIDVVHRGSKHPFLLGEYTNGATKTICVKNEEVPTILDTCMFLRNQKGRKHVKLHEQKRVVASTQGLWRPELAYLAKAEQQEK